MSKPIRSNRIDLISTARSQAKRHLSGALRRMKKNPKRGCRLNATSNPQTACNELEIFNSQPLSNRHRHARTGICRPTAEKQTETVDTDFLRQPALKQPYRHRRNSFRKTCLTLWTGRSRSASRRNHLEKNSQSPNTGRVARFPESVRNRCRRGTAPETPDFNAAADDLSGHCFNLPKHRPLEGNITETVAEHPDFNATADLICPHYSTFLKYLPLRKMAETVADDLSSTAATCWSTYSLRKCNGNRCWNTWFPTPPQTIGPHYFNLLKYLLLRKMQRKPLPMICPHCCNLLKQFTVEKMQRNHFETPDSNTSEADSACLTSWKTARSGNGRLSIYLENIPNNADTSFLWICRFWRASRSEHDLAEMYLRNRRPRCRCRDCAEIVEEAKVTYSNVPKHFRAGIGYLIPNCPLADRAMPFQTASFFALSV